MLFAIYHVMDGGLVSIQINSEKQNRGIKGVYLYRIMAAAVVSCVGTLVLYFFGIFLSGLIGSVYDLVFCLIGAFISTFLFNHYENLSFRSNMIPGVKVVFTTFLIISVGHAAEQKFERQVSIDFEPIGKFFWATIITSWWLIPLTALVLYFLNIYFQKKTET